MSMERVALVTGATGFTGRHLVAYLLALGYEVIGFDCQDYSDAVVEIYQGDIADAARLRVVLNTVRPDVVFHLAALTNPRLPYQELHTVNVSGTLALLEAVRVVCPDAVILVTSTSAVYGRARAGAMPISEEEPFQPANLYAVGKITQEMVAYQYFVEHRLRVIRTRAFNLTGPGESSNFVTSGFARQVAQIEAGMREPVLQVGNLEAVRDFTDVRDAVRAYCLLLDRGEPGAVYNVCSGQGTSIRQLLDMLLDLSSVRDITVCLDAARLQPADVPVQVGSAARLRTITGWAPLISLQQTLRDVLAFWRERIQEESA